MIGVKALGPLAGYHVPSMMVVLCERSIPKASPWDPLQLFLLALILGAQLPIISAASFGSLGVAPEPWKPLHGGSFSGPSQPLSPDPLVSYVWPAGAVNDTLLQIFTVAAVAVGPAPGTPPAAFGNASSAVGNTSCAITVHGAGTLVLDFGVELPAWLEFDSADLSDADAAHVVLGISEYSTVDYVGAFKEGPPVRYGTGCGTGTSACTYRLETNSELYEGVRFGFLTLSQAPSRPFLITGIRAVAQAKAVNYTGSFAAPGDSVLERVWYVAAYTVRATLQAHYMGSILMDRGDRFSWTGDAHPTQVPECTRAPSLLHLCDSTQTSPLPCSFHFPNP